MKKIICCMFLLVLFFLATALDCYAIIGIIHGNVSRVINGDTIIVETSYDRVEGADEMGMAALKWAPVWEEKIRLYGIDCPEIAQPYGKEAKKYLESFLSDKTEVTVYVFDFDKYRRKLGIVCCGGAGLNDPLTTVNINILLIISGYAWVYKGVKRFDATYYWGFTYERFARDMKLGLWQDSAPTPPREYRKQKRKNKFEPEFEQETAGYAGYVSRKDKDMTPYEFEKQAEAQKQSKRVE